MLTRVIVDAHDPAFATPSKFIGPVYSESEASSLASRYGWTVKPDGEAWRRVVPSPEPRRIVELQRDRASCRRRLPRRLHRRRGDPCRRGLRRPTAGRRGGDRQGPRLGSAGDRAGCGHARAGHRCGGRLRRIRHPATARDRARDAGPASARIEFAAGSMGPKVEAVCRFVERTGGRGAIGSLEEIDDAVRGPKPAPRCFRTVPT